MTRFVPIARVDSVVREAIRLTLEDQLAQGLELDYDENGILGVTVEVSGEPEMTVVISRHEVEFLLLERRTARHHH